MVHTEVSMERAREILGRDPSKVFTEAVRSGRGHLDLLIEAGVPEDEARAVLGRLYCDPDTHLTVDLGSTLHSAWLDEKREQHEQEYAERMRELTPQAYERLLDLPGGFQITSKPVRRVFEAMRARGWVLRAVEYGTNTIWASPHGTVTLRMTRGSAAPAPTLYDARMNRLSGKRALALVESTADSEGSHGEAE